MTKMLKKNKLMVEAISTKNKLMVEAISTIKSQAISTPVEAGKALAAALAPSMIVVSTSAAAQPKVKDVTPFGKHAVPFMKPVEEQSAYEQRMYLHNIYGETPEVELSRRTSHTKAELLEAILPEAKKIYLETKNPIFTVRDFIKAFSIWGPAISDTPRSAIRALVKAGKFKEIPHISGRRTTFTYELLDLPIEAPV